MISNEDEQEHPTEEEIDHTLEASFPASDPPGWTLGIDDPAEPLLPQSPPSPAGDKATDRPPDKH